MHLCLAQDFRTPNWTSTCWNIAASGLSWPAYLLGMILGFCVRGAAVFVGTYRSHDTRVTRAGLVADVNAVVLAAAVILLLTSSKAFHHAEESTKELGWKRLVNDTNYGCVTGTLAYFEGSRCPGLMDVCATYHTGSKPSLNLQMVPVNDGGSPQSTSSPGPGDLGHLLYQLEICGAIKQCKALPLSSDGWDLTVRDIVTLPRLKPWTHLTLYRGQLLQDISTQAYVSALGPSPGRRLLDTYATGRVAYAADGGVVGGEVSPVIAAAAVAAAESPSAYNPQAKPIAVQKSRPSAPGSAPAAISLSSGLSNKRAGAVAVNGTQMGNNSTSINHLPVPVMMLSGTDVDAPTAYCLWNGAAGADCMSSFTAVAMNNLTSSAPSCPRSSRHYWDFPICETYRCVNGAKVDHLYILNAEVTAARQQHKTPYFFCLSYDELFGLYIGIIGVAITVCLGTFVLVAVDVVTPLMQAGQSEWLKAGPSAGFCTQNDTGSWRWCYPASFMRGACMCAFGAGYGHMCTVGTVADIILRIVVSGVLGGMITIVALFSPWYKVYIENLKREEVSSGALSSCPS